MLSAPEQFTTERLLLRRHRVSDAAAIFEYASDPQVIHYMDYGPRKTVSEVAEYLKETSKHWDVGDFSWVLTVKSSDHAIGGVACWIENHSVGFGYLLNQNYWGCGYATEAAKALVDWALSQSSIYRVWATCDTENTASIRVLEKCGLVREGRLRCYLVRPNISPIPRDAFMYARVHEAV